jgi:hypothetical protein
LEAVADPSREAEARMKFTDQTDEFPFAAHGGSPSGAFRPA